MKDGSITNTLLRYPKFRKKIKSIEGNNVEQEQIAMSTTRFRLSVAMLYSSQITCQSIGAYFKTII